MMDSTLQEAIEKIKKFDELESNFSPDNNEIFPSDEIKAEWHQIKFNLNTIVLKEIEDYSSFYSREFINDLVSQLNEISDTYKDMQESIQSANKDKFEHFFNKYKTDQSKLFNLLNNPKIKINDDDNFNSDNFMKISKYIFDKNNIFVPSDFYHEIPALKSNELNHKILRRISDFSNQDSTYRGNISKTIIYDIMMDYKNEVNKIFEKTRQKIAEEKIQFDYEKNKAKEEIEKSKNSRIITAFKEEGDSMNDYISILYILIALLFIIIIASLFFRLNTPTHEFKIDSFIYFISFITGLSSLLAYLIKQNNRLVQQRDYFNRCHVELKALPTYVSDIEKSKIDALKIDLAPKYFNGGNDDRSISTPDLNLSNENIKQILDIAKEATKK